VVDKARGRTPTSAQDATTKARHHDSLDAQKNSASHLEVSHDSEFSSDNVRSGVVSRWRERYRAQPAETRVSHCSLVVLDDTEAHISRPLLRVQPSSRFRIRSFT